MKIRKFYKANVFTNIFVSEHLYWRTFVFSNICIVKFLYFRIFVFSNICILNIFTHTLQNPNFQGMADSIFGRISSQDLETL